MSFRRTHRWAGLAAALAALVVAAPAFAAPTGNGVTADFNGDGYADLAVGVPGNHTAQPGAGAVFVIWGTAGGLTTDRQFLMQEDAGETSEADDRFGHALAAGDFNGDRYADLAVAVPFEDIDTVDQDGNPVTVFDAGAVIVYYGSVEWLDAMQVLTEDSPNVDGDMKDGDQLGETLAAANFGKGSQADLAVGHPREDIDVNGNLATDAGAATVIYGSSTGLTGTGSKQWTQEEAGVADDAEGDDRFGLALAAANFGKSSEADLAIGVPFEQSISTSAGPVADAGVVQVLYGSSSNGLTSSGSQLWHQDSPDVNDKIDNPQEFEFFGLALAAGNLGKSSQADLAIGVPGEDASATNFDAGGVEVLYGSSNGLTASGDQFWHQNSSGIEDIVHPGDQFGFAVEIGNFGKSSQADLAVGVPREDVGGDADAGALNVIYGTSRGLSSSNDAFLHQDTTGVVDQAEANDEFGSSLAAWNFGKTSQFDLAVGVPLEDIEVDCYNDPTAPPVEDGGLAHIFYGTSNGLGVANNHVTYQEPLGHCSETGDRFSEGLAPSPRSPGA